MFIVDCLESHAAETPTKRAFRFLPNGDEKAIELTYSQLRARARTLARALNKRVAPGGVALLLYAPGLDFIIAFLACLYAGVTAVPASPPIQRRLDMNIFRLEMICEDAAPDIILADNSTSRLLTAALFKENVKALLTRLIQWNPSAQLALDTIPVFVTEGLKVEQGEFQPLLSSEIAFIQYSSGSTRQPTGIMVTHANLMHNLQGICKRFGIGKKSIMVSWLPHYHDMGLIGFILAPLVSQAFAIILSPQEFAANPLRWLKAIATYRATHTGSPNFGYELCLRAIKQHQEEFDLSNLEVALCGAEPIDPELPQRFYEELKGFGIKKEVFFPVYGLAETTLLAAGGQNGRLPIIKTFDTHKLRDLIVEETESGSKLVGCGQAIENHEILIVDPETYAVQPRERAGEIWLRGPSVAKGYWKKQEATHDIFQAFTQDGQGPFLRTSDMGFMHSGDLFIFGRLKDIIVVHGKKYAPQDIELLAQNAHEGIRKGNIAAFSISVNNAEQLVVVAEKSEKVRTDNQQIFNAILSAIAENCDLPLYAIVLIKPKSISKTTSGKIQRHRVKNRFIANALQELDAWYAPLLQPAGR